MGREVIRRILSTEVSHRRLSDDQLRDSCSASKCPVTWLWVARQRRRVVQGLYVIAEDSTQGLAELLAAHGG